MRALTVVFLLKLSTALLFATVIVSGAAQDKSERSVLEEEREEVLAPEEPKVLLSYLDNELLPYISHVELIDLEIYEACLEEELMECDEMGQAGIYRLPLHQDDEVDKAKEDIDEAWKTFYEAVVSKVHNEINTFPPPWNPLAPCGSHINWGEVLQRQVKGVQTAFAEDQPVYWQDVAAALFNNVPLSLWWEGPLPLQEGAVLTGVTSLEPQPGQIADLFKEPRDAIYHMQPLTAGAPLLYTPDELALPLYPGLEEKEIDKGGNVATQAREKEGLEPATSLEQAQFGFANFFATWGDFSNTWFYKGQGLLFKPSIVASICLIPNPPFVAIIPYIPVPTFVPQVPRAFYGEMSVPEGYALPRLEGEPQVSLPDFDAALPALPTDLPRQPITHLEAYPDAVPCLPQGVIWPSDLGPPPEIRCPEDTPLPPIYEPDDAQR